MMICDFLPDDTQERAKAYAAYMAANEKLQCIRAGCSKYRYGGNDFCEQHTHERAERNRQAALKAVAARRINHPEWGKPAHASTFWQSRAQSFVAAAVKRGVLPRLDGTVACVDCGGVACEYDHRDYSRPLDVQPVCRSCNARRGTAKWPSADQFDFPKVAPKDKAA